MTNQDYSFCEAATAGSKSRWHIRPLTNKGRKPTGGADTPSLCGVTVAWDLEVQIDSHHLNHSCAKCAALFMKESR